MIIIKIFLIYIYSKISEISEMNESKNIGIIVGRFQPLTKVHRDTLLIPALEQCDTVILMLGSANDYKYKGSRDPYNSNNNNSILSNETVPQETKTKWISKNPYSYNERKKMVVEAIKENNPNLLSKLVILPMKDATIEGVAPSDKRFMQLKKQYFLSELLVDNLSLDEKKKIYEWFKRMRTKNPTSYTYVMNKLNNNKINAFITKDKVDFYYRVSIWYQVFNSIVKTYITTTPPPNIILFGSEKDSSTAEYIADIRELGLSGIHFDYRRQKPVMNGNKTINATTVRALLSKEVLDGNDMIKLIEIVPEPVLRILFEGKENRLSILNKTLTSSGKRNNNNNY